MNDIRVWFHVDMDAFYASVEILDNPELEGKPVIIGDRHRRSVASTCSYEARKYGVHSAMPMMQALRLCPQAVVISPRFERYHELSCQIMEIFRTFSSDVRQISIDEAFLDMTGTELLFGTPREAAVRLKKEVREKTGLTISVGIAQNRLIAKMASDYDKPDGLCRVSPGNEIKFVDAVGLNRLWGVGKATRQLLAKRHITSTGQLREFSLISLERLFGQSMGEYLYNVARGREGSMFESESKSHSISTEVTFINDVLEEDVLRQYLLEKSHEIMYQAFDSHETPRTIGLKLRYGDFTTTSIQETPSEPVYCAQQVYDIACRLLDSKWHGEPVRLIGVGLYQLQKGDVPIQDELFSEDNKKRRKVEKVASELREKGLKLTKAANISLKD